ncbi:PREDICTED: uncharacterized protein LOC106744538 [Dinoponera quadriceps]|uniref:Uncharacterized protein LOC106744538 n=1 Tax=Dinoponera quadriceps TaxID=609295 RepID=A0A6P3X9H3_DINQU|nr:PREDICTED: uncharacterized protein LOC106744538 [Dinoponera quadriceps]
MRASGWTHLVDSQRGRDRYESRYRAREETAAAVGYAGAEESERLLQARPRDRGHGGVTDRAQRMAENGEALKYIELVLRQLRRASRDHRRLVQQRHADFRCRIGEGSRSRFEDERVWRQQDRRESPAGRMCSRSTSGPWESDVSSREEVAGRSSESPRPDVTTRLLTKRRDYGGTAQSSTAGVLDGITAAAYQDLRYVPEDWESARETFGAWSLPETPSSHGKRTSSTLV